jgi:hypothetical protein
MIVEYMDIGDMDIECKKCGAMVWYGEVAHKDHETGELLVSLCCRKGNITIPFMREPPPLIRSLFNGTHPKSNHFVLNIRSYNNMFSFTSLGGKIENPSDGTPGPPQFVISGQNYHRIGSLIPSDGNPPKFAQLYIYDTENEVANRLSHFRYLSTVCLTMILLDDEYTLII